MPDWSAWKAVPGGGKTFSAPSAAVRGDTLHLFVRGTDDGVHRKRFNGEWDPWTQVPGDEKTPSGPTSVGLGKYQLTVFIRRSDNTIHANTESGSTSWSGWVEVDGGVEGGRTPSEPTVGLWSPTGPIAINLIV